MQNETASILLAHAQKYPGMHPVDAVKLLYQNEFGSGHMIPDEMTCLLRIMEERKLLPSEKRAPEKIGGGLARLYLQEANRLELASRSIARMFMLAAQRGKGSLASFTEKLWTLRALTARGDMPFGPDALDEYLHGYFAKGCPAVSHSEDYRRLYAPAYRLIGARFGRLLPVVSRVDVLLRTQKRVVVALDGRCASGKSSAAALLARVWDAPVVHMDDFFLPNELRTPERLAEPGGNVHYERFHEEVLAPLRAGRAFSYRIFDCKTRDYAGKRHIAASPVVIVEGAYSLHPSFGEYADAAFFFDIDPRVQLERIRRRDGEAALPMFRERWIPMENRYIETYHIDRKERID